ncbi:hypothetical protein VPG91_06100 [Nitrospirillum amazonense]|uniref:hypothetical protein n=1 Tax=Nitrospirillum amazonense TaxID=28077 RepID=UPI002DD4397F|nr:hypothetical protein [Nitrospirillum amazonense]MEC4590551.1 hypothetical protein [Nitrospirillum amazonense]
MSTTDLIIEEMRLALPPVFAADRLTDLTGGAINWRTLQNLRSRREVPDDIFAYTGRRVLVRRDALLNWWSGTLSTRAA